MNRTGGDKVSIAHAGDDLGWPTIWHCETQAGLITPILTWIEAVPPGGGILYTGNDIPSWKGSFLFGSTGAKHLHRVVFDQASGGATNPNPHLQSHEAYLEGDPPSGLGRLREVKQGTGGELYVTTSNCDNRGNCPATKDGIYRIRLNS
jgi:glucose/arabinose dehydrogenase